MARNRFSLHLDRPRAVITVIFLSHALKRGGLQIARPRPENGRMVDYVSNILDPDGQIEEKINAGIRCSLRWLKSVRCY